MRCSNCNTENDAGNKYCKECGRRLPTPPAKPQDGIDAAKVGELVYAAYKHKDAGRLNDAIAACQGVLMLNHENASAHALLGLLYDESGELEFALYEYERAIELNPADEVSRRKGAELRDRISTDLTTESAFGSWSRKFRPYLAHIAAGTCALVILIAGLIFMLASSHQNKDNGSSPQPVSAATQPVAQNPSSGSQFEQAKPGTNLVQVAQNPQANQRPRPDHIAANCAKSNQTGAKSTCTQSSRTEATNTAAVG